MSDMATQKKGDDASITIHTVLFASFCVPGAVESLIEIVWRVESNTRQNAFFTGRVLEKQP